MDISSILRDKKLTEAAFEFNHLYWEKISKIEKRKRCEFSKIIFDDVVLFLYEKYKSDLGYIKNFPGFRGAVIGKKNEIKNSPIIVPAIEMVKDTGNRVVSESKEQQVEEDHLICWGDDISNLSIEIQEKLGLDV